MLAHCTQDIVYVLAGSPRLYFCNFANSIVLHLMYLLSQFPGGSKDKSLADCSRGIQVLENRDGKRRRLPRSRLGLGYHVTTYKEQKKDENFTAQTLGHR